MHNHYCWGFISKHMRHHDVDPNTAVLHHYKRADKFLSESERRHWLSKIYIDTTALKYRTELARIVSQKLAIFTRLGYLWSRPDFSRHDFPSRAGGYWLAALHLFSMFIRKGPLCSIVGSYFFRLVHSYKICAVKCDILFISKLIHQNALAAWTDWLGSLQLAHSQTWRMD